MLCPFHPHWVMSSKTRLVHRVGNWMKFTFSACQSPSKISGLHQAPLLQTIRKNRFPLGNCSTKRLFPKFRKFLLQAGEMFLQDHVEESPFAKKVIFPRGEKEKKPPTHCFGKSLLLICVPASLPQKPPLPQPELRNVMSESLPSKSPLHFYSPAEPGNCYFAQPDPRNAGTAELRSSYLKGFPSRGNNEKVSLLCGSHLCWFHSLGQGKSQLCYRKTIAAVQHLFCSEF